MGVIDGLRLASLTGCSVRGEALVFHLGGVLRAGLLDIWIRMGLVPMETESGEGRLWGNGEGRRTTIGNNGGGVGVGVS